MRAGPPQQLKVLVLLLVLLAHCICSCQAWRWPWGRKPKDISSAAKCRAASKGHVHKGDDVYDTLHDFFQVNGPAVHLPKNATDITTAATLIQLAVPELKLVLDPMLYLKAFTKPNHGIPKLIHMTTGSKHSLAPHQVMVPSVCLSIDNDDTSSMWRQLVADSHHATTHPNTHLCNRCCQSSAGAGSIRITRCCCMTTRMCLPT